MAFGHLAQRAVPRRRLTAEDVEAQQQADARLDARIAFDAFCEKQRVRIAATLKRQIERINVARFGDCEGDGSHFVVSRKGTTETSDPVTRNFHDQF